MSVDAIGLSADLLKAVKECGYKNLTPIQQEAIPVIRHFVSAVKKAYPELSAEEIFWRLHFTMGTIVFTMSSSEALIDIAQNDFDNKLDIAGVIERVIPYVAAGVAAPITNH